MTPRFLNGAAGGVLGALLAHWVVLAARAATGAADVWLKGPHGPPFFELTLATAAFYASVGAFAGPRRGAAARSAKAAGAAFLALALPMALATRLFSWGETGPSFAWIYMILGSYALANGSGAFAVGWTLGRSRAGLRALAGAGAAWAVDRLAQWAVFGGPQAPPVAGWLAPPAAVLSGLLWGEGIALAAARRSAE
ncbi:MAG: hypothetical protein HY554_16475 [Elusimicrobia bacterium]|nr:hypothetical protein [Elusimicrobiota bacterium]